MITILAPATSANCCVGFDSMGMALDWNGSFSFEKSDSFRITGVDEKYCQQDNLVYQAFCKAIQHKGRAIEPVHIHIDSPIPFARGLGSSSACIAAGLCGANALLELGCSMEELLGLAIDMEGHPDNVAPCFLGGLTVSFKNGDQVKTTQVRCDQWYALAVIPDVEVSTKEARKVLPAQVGLKEAAMQCGRSASFVLALERTDQSMLQACCKDIFHEPYRGKLIEQYESLQKLADRQGIPFWISGSGSTMLFLSANKEQLFALEKTIENLYPSIYMKEMKPSSQGVQIIYG